MSAHPNRRAETGEAIGDIPFRRGIPSGPVRAHNADVAHKLAAEDGSKRLAVAICQHHARYNKKAHVRQYWARKGRGISYGG